MPIWPWGLVSCPLETGRHFVVGFFGRVGVAATVSGLIPECGGITLRVGGRSVQLVDGGGRLLSLVQRMDTPAPGSG
jgi:hypothetical protein